MKLLLAAINAKYIHTNPAVRLLARYGEEQTGFSAGWMEFTINQRREEILRELYRQQPDLLGFSCYIWNYRLVQELCTELRALLPGCVLFLGGPEVSYTPAETLAETACDFVIAGEAEAPFAELCRRLAAGNAVTPALWRDLPSAFWLEQGELRSGAPAAPVPLDELPFPYLPGEEALAPGSGRIVYYECSRGCPFHCQYCLSGCGDRVRFRSLPLVFRDLGRFLQAGVPQVKLMDRTFNCSKEYAMSIWRWLAEQDNGRTNFHFELAAELLDEEMLTFLNGVRPGLFQFEIGVQSTNPDTLSAIRRVTLPDRLTPILRRLQSGRNIHLHLDLIAGLPLESYARFGESFDYVYSLAPDQLQLGFLKLLKGSGLFRERERYGLQASALPPYEVTGTPQMGYAELLRLKMLAEMVELYYNSHRFDRSIAHLVLCFPSPFRMFEALGDWYEAQGLHRAPHSRIEYYTILREFAAGHLTEPELSRFEVLARFDLFRHEKARRLPDWMARRRVSDRKDAVYRFFDDRENIHTYLPAYAALDTRHILHTAHIEFFPFDPQEDGAAEAPVALLFDYKTPCFPAGAAITRLPLALFDEPQRPTAE